METDAGGFSMDNPGRGSDGSQTDKAMSKATEELREALSISPHTSCRVEAAIEAVLAELEQAKADNVVMRRAIGDFVQNVKHSKVAGWGDVSKDTVADASFQELTKCLADDYGNISMRPKP
jgi:hypothetical protein